MKGKVVVITGGSSGIGEAAAIRIAEAGGKVLVVARDEEKLADVRKKITDARRLREDVFVRHHGPTPRTTSWRRTSSRSSATSTC